MLWDPVMSMNESGGLTLFSSCAIMRVDTIPPGVPLVDLYCGLCRRFLQYAYLTPGSYLEHRCRHCKRVNRFYGAAV